MKIQAVSFGYDSNAIPVSKSRPEYLSVGRAVSGDVFTPSFGLNYTEAINKIVRKRFNTDSELEAAFREMFSALKKDASIVKNSDFSTIANLFETSGFRGMLTELWKAYPAKNIENLVLKAQEKNVVLAKKNNKTLLYMVSTGRHGLINAIFDSKNAPRDVQLSFHSLDKKLAFDIGLNKKGDIHIVQASPYESVYGGFYLDTGNRSFRTVHSGSSAPESTYYNKDGTDAFWKNFFYGGPAIAPVW